MPPALEGRWYGYIYDFKTYGDAKRDLAVEALDKCRWDVVKPSGPGYAHSCKVDPKDGSILLTTGAGSGGSTVRLHLTKEGTLSGDMKMPGASSWKPLKFQRNGYPE